MADNRPINLDYATPQPTNSVLRAPVAAVVLIAALVPGLSSSLIRGTVWRCLCLAPIIPIAFLFFGPLWGEVLFRSSPAWREFGLYPFVLTCLLVEAVSILLALDDRKRALRNMNPPPPPLTDGAHNLRTPTAPS
jgi:hypothetical protein